MTILDIGLPSGYTPDIEDLNKVRHVLYLLNKYKIFEYIALTCLCA